MQRQIFSTAYRSVVLFFILATVTACGGDDDTNNDQSSSTSSDVSYSYETVYGDACTVTQPTPGCTFNRDGTRVTVEQDADYNSYGYGSDDLWFVVFDSTGYGKVYNDLGVYQYTSAVSSFSGYIGGTTIGVGTTGLFWENVADGTYWIGRNDVLYNSNAKESSYRQAIN